MDSLSCDGDRATGVRSNVGILRRRSLSEKYVNRLTSSETLKSTTGRCRASRVGTEPVAHARPGSCDARSGRGQGVLVAGDGDGAPMSIPQWSLTYVVTFCVAVWTAGVLSFASADSSTFVKS